jgi:hypothetical protein
MPADPAAELTEALQCVSAMAPKLGSPVDEARSA